MKKLALLLLAASVSLSAQGKEEDRLRACGTVVTEILNMPDVPGDMLHRAECVIVFPDVKKFAVGVGGSYGRGAMTCRTGRRFHGSVELSDADGARGRQHRIADRRSEHRLRAAGDEDRGAMSVLSSKVKLGADASAAAGPKGRTAGAATDAAMRAEILTYSRTRGVFAGVSLEGFDPRPDEDGNKLVYGSAIAPRDLVKGGVAVPRQPKRSWTS